MSHLVVAGAALVFAVCLVAPTGATAGTARWGCPTQPASFVPPARKCRPPAAKYDRVPLAELLFAKDGLCLANCGRSSHRAMTLFAIPKPTEEEMEERKEQLRVLLSASKEEINKLVRQNPTVLDRRNIEMSHGPKVKLLEDRFGINQKDAGRLFLKGNRVLKTSLATMENRMDWLQAKLNLSKSQMRRIVERDPNVLALSTDDNLEPTIDNIQSSLELSDEEMTKLVDRTPDVLRKNMSAESIKQRILFLQELLDLPENDVNGVRKYITRAPEILFWPEESMKGNHQWIQQRFGLGDAKIAQMCRHMPQLLYSNTTTLGDKAGKIQADLSLGDEELGDLVSKFPAIMCCLSPEKNVRPKLRYLRTRFELDEDALKHLVLKATSLFSLSQGNIEEKLQFYSKLVGEREAKRLVVERSYLLMKSLEKRLKPRLEEVEKSGTKVRWNETLINRLATRRDDLWEAYGLGEAKR